MKSPPATPGLNRLATLLSLLLLGFVVLFGLQSWRSEKVEQLRQLQTVLELSQRALDRYFLQVEAGLRGLALDVQGARDGADLARVQGLLRRFNELHHESVSVNYVRLDGQILASSRGVPPDGRLFSLAGESSFQDFRAALRPETTMELGRPLLGAVSRQWVFPLRYVLRDARGTPTAVLALSVPVAFLQGFWSQAPMTEQVLIGLMRDDGYLLSRYPVPFGVSPAELYGQPRSGALRRHLQDNGFPQRGYVEGYNPQVGVTYGNAYMRLEHYPVTVFVGLPTREFSLAGWRRVQVPLLLVVLLGGAGVFGYRATLRVQRAREFERLQAEATLREREAEQRFVLDHMLAGVVVHAADGSVLHGNLQASRLIGLTPDQMSGRAQVDPGWRFVREDGSAMPVDEYPVRRVMATGQPLHGGVLGVVQPGRDEPVWLLCDGYPDFDDRRQLRRIVVSIVDITARRHAEQTLAESESRYRMLFENSLDGVLQTRPDGSVLRANAAACTIFGLSQDGLRSRGRNGVVDAADPRLKALLGQRERDGTVRGEVSLLRGDGSRFEAEVSSSIYADETGQRVSSLVVRDVTDRRRTEAALSAKALAERANRAKSEFTARMSHELRTPLNAILGFSQVLAIDTQQPLLPLQRERLGHIREAGEHLLRLIDDLLDLSLIESGTMKLVAVEINLHQLALDALREVVALAGERDVRLRCEAPAARSAFARGDRTRIKQVLLNLLSNAIKYNRPGGDVLVTLGSSAADFRFAVQDTGVGMSPEQIDALYQPFNRLGREQSAVEGTGIGLVISRSLVQLMGGRIEVHSEPGRGTRFEVALPHVAAADRAAGDGVMPLPPVARAEVEGRVLYIDDDAVNRVLMQGFLGLRPGVQLLLAAGGAEGLALAREQAPDLLLVDMMMPDINGLQVLQAVRADPTLHALPCIALSANAMPHEIEAALAAGFDGYLTKPLSAPLLLAEIDCVLGGLAAQAPAEATVSAAPAGDRRAAQPSRPSE